MTYTVVSLHGGFYFLKLTGFFMPFLCLARSALCGFTQLQSKMDWPRILSGAEHRATPGTLLKYTTACLIESPTMSRMTAISSLLQLKCDTAMPMESSSYINAFCGRWGLCHIMFEIAIKAGTSLTK